MRDSNDRGPLLTGKRFKSRQDEEAKPIQPRTLAECLDRDFERATARSRERQRYADMPEHHAKVRRR